MASFLRSALERKEDEFRAASHCWAASSWPVHDGRRASGDHATPLPSAPRSDCSLFATGLGERESWSSPDRPSLTAHEPPAWRLRTMPMARRLWPSCLRALRTHFRSSHRRPKPLARRNSLHSQHLTPPSRGRSLVFPGNPVTCGQDPFLSGPARLYNCS